MGDISDMSFWALQVPAKKLAEFEIEQSPDTAQYVHVTNVALGADAKEGPHTLSIIVRGQEVVLATLDKKSCCQHGLDFVLDETVVFKNSGSTPLHVCGYQTISEAPGEGDYSDDEMGEDEEESSDDDDEAPVAVPIGNGKAAAKKKPAAKQEDSEDEDEDEDYDEGEDDEGESDGEDDEGMEDDDDDIPTPGEQIGSDDLVGEFSDDDEDEEGEEDEDEDEDEEEEEEKPAAKPAVGAKRPAAAAAALTPAPKKQKAPEGKPVPKSAPPKQSGGDKGAKGAATPSVEPKTAADYEKALITFLKQQPGQAAPMAQLGTKVHRPPGVAKLSSFIKDKPAFRIEDNGQKLKYVGAGAK